MEKRSPPVRIWLNPVTLSSSVYYSRDSFFEEVTTYDTFPSEKEEEIQHLLLYISRETDRQCGVVVSHFYFDTRRLVSSSFSDVGVTVVSR